MAALLAARGRAGLTLVAARAAKARSWPRCRWTLLGLDAERRDLFHRWGLQSLGDLAALPAVGLAERLGPEGARLRRMARGEDDLPLRGHAAAGVVRVHAGAGVARGRPGAAVVPARAASWSRSARGCARAAAARPASSWTSCSSTAAPTGASCSPRPPRPIPGPGARCLLLDLEAHPPDEAIAGGHRPARRPRRRGSSSSRCWIPPSPRPSAWPRRWRACTSGPRRAARDRRRCVDTHRPGAFVMGTFSPGGPGSVRRAPPSRASRCASSARRSRRTSRCATGEPAFRVRGRHPRRGRGPGGTVAGLGRLVGRGLEPGGMGRVAGRRRLYRIFRDRMRDAWFVEGEMD